MSRTEEFKKLPASIQRLLDHGVKLTDPEQVILFGSRARGDHRDASDYDIAFKNLSSPKKWSSFKIDYEEEPITLQKIDLLVYEECSSEYQGNIDKEGVLLYGK